MIVVVLYHIGVPLKGGFVGVDIFFVVSGYVITLMLCKEINDTGRINYLKFYVRRIRRLVPAASLVMVTTLALSFLLQSPLGGQQRTSLTAIGANVFNANFVIARLSGDYFDAPAESNPLLHFWSLSVEEQFYLFFPLLISFSWFKAKKKNFSKFPLKYVVVIAIASFILGNLGSFGISIFGFEDLLGFYSPIIRAWEFAVGSLLALQQINRHTSVKNVIGMNVISLLGSMCLIFSFLVIDGSKTPNAISTILPVIGTAFILKAGGGNRYVSRFLESRPMVKVGDWSYSIYLWHWPFISFTKSIFPDRLDFVVLAAIISIFPALVSFYFIESPIRENRIEFLKTFSSLVIWTFPPVTLIASGLFLYSEFQLKPKVESQLHSIQVVLKKGCHWGGGSDPVPCFWNEESEGNPVYLMGDSNAAHFVEGLIISTTELDRPLISNTSSSCPFLFLFITSDPNTSYAKDCLSRNERLMSWIQSQRPGTVILSFSDEYFINKKYSIKSSNGSLTSNPQEKLESLRIALSKTIEMLTNGGHRVVLVQPVPHFIGHYAWDSGNCPAFKFWSDRCVKKMPLLYVIEKNKKIVSIYKEIAFLYKLEIVDFSREVCPYGICTVSAFSGTGYRDATHISVEMDKSLAPVWKEIIS